MTNRRELIRPTQIPDEMVDQNWEEVLCGMESDEEPENVDEEIEPEEAVEAVRRKLEPLPSEEEQRKHRVTHLPFRSWCPHCIAGAANDDPHRAKKLKAQGPLEVQEVHWDYCFPARAAIGQLCW